jgi:hypothetical protein
LEYVQISSQAHLIHLFLYPLQIVDLDHYHKDQFIARVGHSSWFNGSLAIVSYLIFGSLAAITYAFSFRKSDDRLYKFIATSAVSLVCIILLALGKARISKKSYIRTVTLYIVTGFWSVVVGFFAGEYIKNADQIYLSFPILSGYQENTDRDNLECFSNRQGCGNLRIVGTNLSLSIKVDLVVLHSNCWL